jgi:hypothetical protein
MLMMSAHCYILMNFIRIKVNNYRGLKVVGNEKGGGSGSRLLLEYFEHLLASRPPSFFISHYL